MTDASPQPRSWRRAFVTAAWTIWLPTLLPAATGMLAECAHCATTYALSLPIVPGLIAAVAMGLQGVWFVVGGGAATLALLGVVAIVRHEAPRGLAQAVQAAAALLSAVAAIGYAHALRM